ASDTTNTVSIDRNLYFYPVSPVSHLPVQDDPLGEDIHTTTPILRWHNVDPQETDHLLVRIYQAENLIIFVNYSEIFTEILSPWDTETTVPAGLLNIGSVYCWEITAVHTGPGGDDAGHGVGFSSMSDWPSLTESSCFQVSP
ncbi:MAG: hypothetical protein NTV04_20210, partial [Deltaproteobacteria bacterium]|nr:hypothetical protein [Deltaproteobacteria bacterium]